MSGSLGCTLASTQWFLFICFAFWSWCCKDEYISYKTSQLRLMIYLNLYLFCRSYYMGYSFTVRIQFVVSPIEIACALLLQVLFITLAKMPGLKFSITNVREFLFVFEEESIIYGYFVPVSSQSLFSRMNFSILVLIWTQTLHNRPLC